ncbi:MAG: MerR family transcriptional regulator [Thermoleophilia bacterium]
MSTRAGRDHFLIGVAAARAGMHPQTLRVYERRGLITPVRTKKNTRMYSEDDVALLRRIQQLSEEGIGLAGIERILGLERRLARAERRIADLAAELAATRQRHADEIAAVHAAQGQIVPIPRGTAALVPRYRPVIRYTRPIWTGRSL